MKILQRKIKDARGRRKKVEKRMLSESLPSWHILVDLLLLLLLSHFSHV